MKKPIEPHVSNLMDSLRGVSALIVAFAHAFQIFCLPYFGLYGFPHLFTSALATYAVVVFFIVSGFMIFLSVENHSDKFGFKVLEFFKARLIRIYPPLILSLVICIAVYQIMTRFNINGAESFRLGGELYLAREKVSFEWGSFISTLLLIYNIIPNAPPALLINGPLWTLSYEWWFYLLTMFIVNAISNKKIVCWLPVIIIAIFFFLAGSLLWKLLLIWCSGYFLGYLYKSKKLYRKTFDRIIYLSIVLCIICIFLIGKSNTFLCLAEPLQRYGKDGATIMMFVGLILTAIIGLVISQQINLNFLRKTARYSYTLYLIHFPIFLIMFGLLHEYLIHYSWKLSLLVGIFSTLIAIAVAYKFSLLVENRQLMDKYLKRLFH